MQNEETPGEDQDAQKDEDSDEKDADNEQFEEVSLDENEVKDADDQ